MQWTSSLIQISLQSIWGSIDDGNLLFHINVSNDCIRYPFSNKSELLPSDSAYTRPFPKSRLEAKNFVLVFQSSIASRESETSPFSFHNIVVHVSAFVSESPPAVEEQNVFDAEKGHPSQTVGGERKSLFSFNEYFNCIEKNWFQWNQCTQTSQISLISLNRWTWSAALVKRFMSRWKRSFSFIDALSWSGSHTQNSAFDCMCVKHKNNWCCHLQKLYSKTWWVFKCLSWLPVSQNSKMKEKKKFIWNVDNWHLREIGNVFQEPFHFWKMYCYSGISSLFFLRIFG